jgi:hypothetical protein
MAGRIVVPPKAPPLDPAEPVACRWCEQTRPRAKLAAHERNCRKRPGYVPVPPKSRAGVTLPAVGEALPSPPPTMPPATTADELGQMIDELAAALRGAPQTPANRMLRRELLALVHARYLLRRGRA